MSLEKGVEASSSGTGVFATCPSEVASSVFGLLGSKACLWTGRIEDLPGHVARCPHAKIPCPGGCGTQLPRKSMAMHVQECLQCPDRLVPCPNGCIRQSKPFCLPFSDVEEHRKECPKEPISCPFADSGCTASIPRYQLPYHEKVGQQPSLT